MATRSPFVDSPTERGGDVSRGPIVTAMVVCGLSVLLTAGCGATIPTDPDGTLDRARGGTLRVGATANGSWVDLREGEDPAGREPDLVRSFASTLDADVAWSSGSEEALVAGLEDGDLDLVIGGLSEDTPWSEEAGMTRPYTESIDGRGGTVKHVMLVPLGENALLFELDSFLLGSGDPR